MGSGVWTQNKILSKKIIDFHPTREKAILEEAKLIHHNYYNELNRNYSRPYKSFIENGMTNFDKIAYENKWLKQMEIKRLKLETEKLNDPVRIKKENDKKQRLILSNEKQRLKDIKLKKQRENETIFNTYLSDNIDQWCIRIKAVFGVVITDIIDEPFLYITTNDPVKIMEDIILHKPPTNSKMVKGLFKHINDKNITHKVTLKLMYVVNNDGGYDYEYNDLLKATETEALNNNYIHYFEERRTHILNNINDAIDKYLSS